MHFDPLTTMAGRHLVYAYATVFLVQAGYLGWIVRDWLRLDSIHLDAEKNQRS